MDFTLIKHPSVNYDERQYHIIDTIVIHYTDMPNMQESLERLCDKNSKVSCHYVIDRNGDIYELVAPKYRAWHAGLSFWLDKRNINENSIGIELQNKGHSHGYEDFPLEQMNALNHLLFSLRMEYLILPNAIVGHSDVAPDRKIDPGEKFDWRLMARHGNSLWPLPSHNHYHDDHNMLFTSLGYDPEASLQNKIKAFQYRFRPHLVSGEMDEETLLLINGLLDMYQIIYDNY